MATAPTHHPNNETTEDPIVLNQSTVEAARNQDWIEVDDDFDHFEKLESVLSDSSTFLPNNSFDIINTSSAAGRQEEIKKAIENLESFLNKNLEDIFDNSEERATFENILLILKTANEKEFSDGLKAFLVALKESVTDLFDQYSLCEIDVKSFKKLEVEKQEIQELGRAGKKEKKDIDDEILKYKTVAESNTTEISSLEQQLFVLQQKLDEVKARKQTNSQKMLVLQAKKKSICENATNLLERGKKVMESRVSLQSKYDVALHQQASLKNQWTTLRDAFLEKQLEFEN